MWSTWGTEKKFVLASFLFVFLTFGVTAVFFEQTVSLTKYGERSSFDASQPVGYTALGEESSNGKIKAMLKGSIYETGENMTVFGACFDGDGYPLPEADAKFTAWYPNGSIVTGPNATMDKIYDDFVGYHANGTGRWKIHVTMSSTIGTYLTEIRCEYQDQWALAFGEWQNPEWVKKIGDSYLMIGNMTTAMTNVSNAIALMYGDLQIFRNETQNNFSTVISMLGSLNTSVGNVNVDGSTKLKEMYNAILALPTQFWVLDEKNPTYSLASGVNNFRAVDMVDENNVCTAGVDGSFQCWDGNVWTYGNYSDYKWLGVGMMQASAPYVWYVGTDTAQTTPYYSVNGGTPQIIGSSVSEKFYDVKLVRAPNNPAGAVTIYVAGESDISYSTDFGATWSQLGGFSGTAPVGDHAVRMSNIVWNVAPDVTNGYQFSVVTVDGQLYHYNGTDLNQVVVQPNSQFEDVVLIYPDLMYVVGYDADSGKNTVWKYNGINSTVVYEWENATSANPTGIAASSTDDVWIVTKDPSVFYHYNGFQWEYVSFPYSRYLSITIGFGNFSTSTGLRDIVMSDEFSGYAVGDDGLVLKFMNKQDAQFQALLENLTDQINNIKVNLTPVLNAIGEVNATTQSTLQLVQAMNLTLYDMNQAMNGNFTVVNEKLDAMNLSLVEQMVILNAINATVVEISSDVQAMQLFLNAMNVSMSQNFLDLNVFLTAMNASVSLQLQNVTNIVSDVQMTVNGLVVSLTEMNVSIVNGFSGLNDKLDQMNSSIQYKLDNIYNNVSYGNLYMETTLFPMMNATYQNTLDILAYLGIIDAKLNMTIELQNQTLQIVNATDIKVDQLLNRSNRIRAWVTQ